MLIVANVNPFYPLGFIDLYDILGSFRISLIPRIYLYYLELYHLHKAYVDPFGHQNACHYYAL